MNLIKHLINLMFLWTIPYVIVLFFMLITGFAFTYSEGIHSDVFVVISTFYSIVMLMAYLVGNSEEDFNHLKILKTK